MQELLRYIVRHQNGLVFLVLELIALCLVVGSNPYPHSTVFTTANEYAAWQHRRVAAVTDYFALDVQNDELRMENAALRTRLADLEQRLQADEAAMVADSVCRGWDYIPACVIRSQSRGGHNYLTLDVGSAEGIRAGMGVRSALGVVGTVSAVGEHYCLVVPIIHTRAVISTMLLRDGYRCSLGWDGVDYRVAQLRDVATHVGVAVGDTVVTSGLTEAFPAGIPVGTVTRCRLHDGDSYYSISVRLAVDFRRLRYVQVVTNPDYEPISVLNHAAL